ncbi:hypothetical protein ADL26_15115, partial [Thermoactinomyces vulgaris]
GQRDLDLGAAVLEVQGERHDGVAGLLRLRLQLVDLLPVQQQLALAARRVVGPGALAVLGDVDVVQPRLVPVELDEAVDEEARPCRSDFTSVPVRTSPAS